jgi:hypothetical protein
LLPVCLALCDLPGLAAAVGVQHLRGHCGPEELAGGVKDGAGRRSDLAESFQV